ncbi:MAG: polyphenol oxidase family protein [Acidimicrobiales bacterium]
MLCTDRSHGDLSGDWVRAHLGGVPCTTLSQMHGAEVVVVQRPGDKEGAQADAAVSVAGGLALAVRVADCVPIGLASPEGAFGVVHAGWRGLAGGVVEAAVGALRALGASRVEAVVGPCVHAECYPFGTADIAPLVERYGSGVASHDRHGNPALDLPGAVRLALTGCMVDLVGQLDVCTACSEQHWSWRARGDLARQGLVAWKPGDTEGPVTWKV